MKELAVREILSTVSAVAALLASCAGAGFAAPPGDPKPAIHSVARLAAEIQRIEAPWRESSWNQRSAHRQIRSLITQYVAYELDQGPAARGQLEKNLSTAINAAMWRSWAEHPARILFCCPGVPGAYVVAFVLDEAAGGATAAIQTYKAADGVWTLASEGGSEMNDTDMDVLLFPVSENGLRLFAYGGLFGANQAVSRGIVYSISESGVKPIWRMKDTLGLSAKMTRRGLVLRYRDAKLFYARRYPDAFQDVYMQNDGGLSLLSHTPLPPAEQ